MGAAQVLDHALQSAVGQPCALDDGAVFGQAEDARARVARLRARRDRAHLDESEAEGRELAERLAVAVEAGGQPDGVAEPDAEDLAFEGGVLHAVALVEQPASSRDHADDAQQQDNNPVCPLDREREEDGFYDSLVHANLRKLAQRYKKKMIVCTFRPFCNVGTTRWRRCDGAGTSVGAFDRAA